MQKTKRKEWQLHLNNNEFSQWQRQQHTFLLFFDGAATGNPGVAGAGGVIYDSDGQKVVDFSWGLGKNTNNRAETLAVYMGLKIAHARSIRSLVVLGDSEIVIKDLLGLSISAHSIFQWPLLANKHLETTLHQITLFSYPPLSKH
jgi:ribonuclease HI